MILMDLLDGALWVYPLVVDRRRLLLLAFALDMQPSLFQLVFRKQLTTQGGPPLNPLLSRSCISEFTA